MLSCYPLDCSLIRLKGVGYLKVNDPINPDSSCLVEHLVQSFEYHVTMSSYRVG